MSSDIADVYARLQAETAKMLALDINALTPSQEVRVGMVAGLRLELDRLQVAQLRINDSSVASALHHAPTVNCDYWVD